MNGFTEIEELEGNIYTAWEVDKKLKEEGKLLVGFRVRRPSPDSDGSFKEEAIYTIGKPMERTDISE